MKNTHKQFIAGLGFVSAASAGSTPNPMVGGKEMLPNKDIIDNAVNSADHTTLVAAVKAADLVTTLKGAGPFTVFAPTNAAFAKLPAGTVESSISAALGACSPPRTTIGVPVALIRRKPEQRSCGPPRMRATTMSAPSRAAPMSWWPGRAGLAHTYSAPEARALSRSVSLVDSRAIRGIWCNSLGVRAPGRRMPGRVGRSRSA